MKGRIWKNLAQFACAIFFLVIVWQVAYALAGNEFLVPKLAHAIKATGRLFGDSGFWVAFFRTLLRVLIAFLPCFVFAFIFAFFSIRFARFYCFAFGAFGSASRVGRGGL